MNRFTRKMPLGKAIAFIQGMWAAAGRDVPNDEQAIEEWTDRFYCVRSRYSDGSVIVYTHGATAAGDSEPLPSPIVEYLAAWDELDRLNEALQQRTKVLGRSGFYEGKGHIQSEELRADLGANVRLSALDRCTECLAGTTPIGSQRYRCMTCGKTHTARKPRKPKKTDAQKSKDYRDRKKSASATPPAPNN